MFITGKLALKCLLNKIGNLSNTTWKETTPWSGIMYLLPQSGIVVMFPVVYDSSEDCDESTCFVLCITHLRIVMRVYDLYCVWLIWGLRNKYICVDVWSTMVYYLGNSLAYYVMVQNGWLEQRGVTRKRNCFYLVHA